MKRMSSYLLPVTIFVLGGIIVSLHYFALAYHLYFSIWWFDLLVHSLSGALVGLFVISVLMQFFAPSLLSGNTYPLLLQVILCTVIVGTFWETFELAFRLIPTDLYAYISDTASDMMMNVIGATAGYFCGLLYLRKQTSYA